MIRYKLRGHYFTYLTKEFLVIYNSSECNIIFIDFMIHPGQLAN